MLNEEIKYTVKTGFNPVKANTKEKDTRQLVLDFSKLVMGDAENKLFVGPLNNYYKEQLDIFSKIAMNCRGNVWVALIPHPAKWKGIEVNENDLIVRNLT